MAQSFRTVRRVEFCETDAAGIAHFSAFFQYMEQAEHALLRHLGTSVVTSDDEGTISWPRVSAGCEYTGAVRFEDEMDVEVRILRMGERSVTYGFVFFREGAEIAKGKMTAVCCRITPDQPPRSIPIPNWILERLRPLLDTPEGT